MADGVRPESFLPTIKCSTCGREIDMMMLADHVCTPPKPSDTVTSVPSSSKPVMGLDPAIQTRPGFVDSSLLQTRSPGFLRPSRNAPPRIDANGANRPFLQVDQLTPQSEYSNYSDGGRSTAPVSPSTQVTTPSSMFSRKPVENLPSRTTSPPSPHLASNLDSAFPHFPSRLDKPTSGDGDRKVDANMRPPLSPKANAGPNILQRMKTVASGPFFGQARSAERSEQENQDAQVQRNASAPGPKQFRNQEGRAHFRKKSGGISVRSIDRYESSAGAESENLRNPPHQTTIKPVKDIDKYLEELESIAEPSPMLSVSSRSRTFPEDESRRREQRDFMSPPPSAPSTRSAFYTSQGYDDSSRPTTSGGPGSGFGGFGNSVDPAIQGSSFGSNQQPSTLAPSAGRSRARTVTKSSNSSRARQEEWSAPPSAQSNSGRIRSRTVTRPGGRSEVSRMDRRMDGAPPVPHRGSVARQPSNKSQRGETYHSPNSSDSSYASSSLSTPATSVGTMSRSGSASDDRYIGNRSRSQRQSPPEAIQSQFAPPPPAGGFFSSPESPMDPAIQSLTARPIDPAIQQGGNRSFQNRPDPRRPKEWSPPKLRPELRVYDDRPKLAMDRSPPRTRQQQTMHDESVRASPQNPAYEVSPRLPLQQASYTEPARLQPDPALFTPRRPDPVPFTMPAAQPSEPTPNMEPQRTPMVPEGVVSTPQAPTSLFKDREDPALAAFKRPFPVNQPVPKPLPRERSLLKEREPPASAVFKDREDPALEAFKRPIPVSKGACKGCGLDIFGKSVKAADGRLPGRYHKECFVCKTCKVPFPTGEFYVHQNAPVCNWHYHQLNGSVCRKCDRGIEGQYLETDSRAKYHPTCFSCSRCSDSLKGDYFEIDGKPVCEKHATPNRAPGGMIPVFERRSTKLMNMI